MSIDKSFHERGENREKKWLKIAPEYFTQKVGKTTANIFHDFLPVIPVTLKIFGDYQRRCLQTVDMLWAVVIWPRKSLRSWNCRPNINFHWFWFQLLSRNLVRMPFPQLTLPLPSWFFPNPKGSRQNFPEWILVKECPWKSCFLVDFFGGFCPACYFKENGPKSPRKKSTPKFSAETKHQNPRVISGKGCPWERQ